MAIKVGLALLAALTLVPPAAHGDLKTIVRSIAREPLYQSRLPKYCLLVVGPEATKHVWLVLDGHDLFVDRNDNGDLTEPGELVTGKVGGKWLNLDAGELVEPNGKSRTLNLRIHTFNAANGKCAGMEIVLDGNRRHFVGFDEANPLQFAHRPDRAPIVHLEGPLELRSYGEPPTLTAGEEVDLNVVIGTPGVGPGSFCAIHCRTVLDQKVAPTAVIEFPQRPGQAQQLVRLFSLAEDGRDHFATTVRTPDEAGSGLAKITISCLDWKEEPVATLSLELPVVASPKKHAVEHKGIKSINAENETAIKFINKSEQTIKVHWIDYEGKRQLKAVLNAGESVGPQRTFMTHPWLITDADEAPWYVFLPDAQLRTIEILAPVMDGKAEVQHK